MKHPNSLALSMMACVLAACGGGGGGSGGNPPPTPPANTAPTFTTITFNATEDTDLAAALAATDAQGQAITFTLITNPAHGVLTGFTAAGQFTYRGSANFNGADTFSVRATDSAGAQATATVTMNVAPVNDAPVLSNDVLTASGSNPLLDVLANDLEPDGEALTLTLEGTPDFGTATVENGRVRLALPAGFQGFNTFGYRAVDAAGGGGTARAVVFVDAEPVRFIYTTNEDGDYARNIYVDDLLTRRRATSFLETSPTAMGQWVYVSTNGRTIVFDEVDATPAVSGRRFWTAIAADGSTGPTRINPPLTAGQSLTLASEPSPDGRWVVYRIQQAGESRFYLADLIGGGAPREILPPVADSRIDASGEPIYFDGQSQFMFVAVSVHLGGGERGMTIYRAPLTAPNSMQLFFSPPEANRSTYIGHTGPDGDRAIVIAYPATGARLYLARATHPTDPLPLSPAVLNADQLMGSYRPDWAHDRMLFNIDSVPGNPPDTSVLHVSSLVTGAWTALGNIPTYFGRPEIAAVHPGGNSILTTSRVTDPVTGGAEEVREIDLVAGAPSRRFTQSNEYQGARYTNDGNTVMLVRIGGELLTFPRNDPSQSKSLFTAGIAGNYRSSPDGKILSASGVETCCGRDDSIWAFNQTTGPGTFAKRLVQVPIAGHTFTYVSVGDIVPRY